MATTIMDIPKEIQTMIVSHLDNYSKVLLRRTCHHFRGLYSPRINVNFEAVSQRAIEENDLDSFKYYMEDTEYCLIIEDDQNVILQEILTEDNYEKLKIWKSLVSLNTKDELKLFSKHIVFKGDIWKKVKYMFTSYDNTVMLLKKWSKLADTRKYFHWLFKHGVTLDFLRRAMEDYETNVFISIAYETKTFLSHYSFSNKQIENIQSFMSNVYNWTCLECVEDWEYVSPSICKKAKENGEHDQIKQWCDCCQPVVRKKLKI